MMEDRLLLYLAKSKSMESFGDTTGRSYMWPIAEPERVNELRKAAGFDLTVEENAERLDAITTQSRNCRKSKRRFTKIA